MIGRGLSLIYRGETFSIGRVLLFLDLREPERWTSGGPFGYGPVRDRYVCMRGQSNNHGDRIYT